MHIQDYWVSGLCTSSGILNSRKRNILETESVSLLRWGEGDTTLLVLLERASPNHWKTHVEVEVNLWPMVSWQVCLGVTLPSETHDQSFVFCLTFASFLTWGAISDEGWVCNIPVQLLLDPARRVTLGSKFLRTHDHILLPHMWLPQPGGPSAHIYILQEQGGPAMPPGTGFPFCHLLWGILTPLHMPFQDQAQAILRPTVSRPVCRGVVPLLE
jgi:hypothetical protein